LRTRFAGLPGFALNQVEDAATPAQFVIEERALAEINCQRATGAIAPF
jgi:hypothetical protein